MSIQLTGLPDDVLDLICSQLTVAQTVQLAAVCKVLRASLQNCSALVELLKSLRITAKDSALVEVGKALSEMSVSWRKMEPKLSACSSHTSYVMGTQFNSDFIVSAGGIGDNRVLLL